MAISGPRGLFITLEGPDGAGKSTQAAILCERLTAAGYAVTATREPGGTPVAERIREILLGRGTEEISAETEAFLVCAARAENVARVIAPALAAGRIVVCDRFADATLAYQGFGGHVSLALLGRMNACATHDLKPSLTLLLDLPVAAGLERRRRDGGEWTRLDAADESFHERVRAGYLALAKQEPARWVIVDARADPAAIADAIWSAVLPRLPLAPLSGA